MHLLSILILETSLNIKINKHLSGKIQTSTGITQGDCLRAIFFIFYLSLCFNNQEQTNNIHKYKNNNTRNILIEPKYADDIVWITTSEDEVERVKANISSQILKYNLKTNTNKTGEFISNNNSQPDWKK